MGRGKKHTDKSFLQFPFKENNFVFPFLKFHKDIIQYIYTFRIITF